jgi:hypothetical protein
MTDLRKAAEMALEALEDVFDLENKDVEAIQALRQALAEPANSTTDFVEPVAWIEKDKDYLAVSADPFENAIPVYTAPPKREWVGLKGDEISECWKTGDVVAAVEAKLKEKNT